MQACKLVTAPLIVTGLYGKVIIRLQINRLKTAANDIFKKAQLLLSRQILTVVVTDFTK